MCEYYVLICVGTLLMEGLVHSLVPLSSFIFFLSDVHGWWRSYVGGEYSAFCVCEYFCSWKGPEHDLGPFLYFSLCMSCSCGCARVVTILLKAVSIVLFVCLSTLCKKVDLHTNDSILSKIERDGAQVPIPSDKHPSRRKGTGIPKYSVTFFTLDHDGLWFKLTNEVRAWHWDE